MYLYILYHDMKVSLNLIMYSNTIVLEYRIQICKQKCMTREGLWDVNEDYTTALITHKTNHSTNMRKEARTP